MSVRGIIGHDAEKDSDNQRRIILSDNAISTAAHKEVTAADLSLSSTSGSPTTRGMPSASSVLSAKDLRDALKSVSQLKFGIYYRKKAQHQQKKSKNSV